MRRAAALFAGIALALVWSQPASALCAEPPSLGRAIAETSVVFAGTVTDTSSEGRWATVAVSDVWKGDVAAEVEVRGGPEDPPGPISASSSVERTYRRGETYLVLPYAGSGEVFSDNACSGTTVYREGLARLRPAGAHAPPEEPEAASSGRTP
ncbi:MAG TPA: hypothetical protein VEV43_15455, partial [Actinomycetota bacterium]|nr:hypothetical protein [Actinomycetota bacterium]